MSDVTNEGVGKCRARAAGVLGHNGCDLQGPCHWQVHHDSAQVGESVGCADGQHGGSALVADELGGYGVDRDLVRTARLGADGVEAPSYALPRDAMG